MPKPNLGRKHTCSSCGTKYYDMNKADPICPKCGKDARESVLHAVEADDPALDDGALALDEVFSGEGGAEEQLDALDDDQDTDLDEGDDDFEGDLDADYEEEGDDTADASAS